MKIRFLKNITVDVETRQGEIFDKAYSRWAEVRVEAVYPAANYSTVKLEDGSILHGVPSDAFERLAEEKRTITL